MTKNTKKRKVIVFDLDGTFYALRGGSYKKSTLRRSVLRNARQYIESKLSCDKKEALRILRGIQKKYGEQISIGLEKEFGIDRYDYFNTVWDIPARGIVKKSRQLAEMFSALQKQYRFALVSDAPRVWIDNVLAELGIQSFFHGSIFSGEGNRRKGFGNAFRNIVKTLKTNPKNCIAVGDQEETDILPAKKAGMRTILVSRRNKQTAADFQIKNLAEILRIHNL